MNLFEYAKEMELDGMHFYQNAAECAPLPGFKSILLMLADEEKKHYMFFNALEQSFEIQSLLPFPAAQVENVFHQLRRNKEGFDFTAEQTNTYVKALEIEKQSEKFYREQAALTTDENLKKQILLVAEEEEKHVLLLTDLVECINRPEQRVEQ